MNVKWRGSKQLAEQPESGQLDFKSTQNTCVAIFSGPYDVCKSNRPKRGSEISGYTGFTVQDVSIKKKSGGIGIMTISLAGAVDSISALNKEVPEIKYEIEWSQLEKALITHPRYAEANQQQGGKPLVSDDKVAIKFWEDCPNADIKEAKKYFPDPNKTSKDDAKELSDNAKDYASKILNGTDSYLLFNPICRRTTTTLAVPAESKAGHLEVPQGNFPKKLIQGWSWLKTADRSTQSGSHARWERIEEWTGTNTWDPDLYPST